MRIRTLVLASLAALSVLAGSGVAHAAPTTSYSLRGYDPAVTAIPGGYILDGAAWGDLLEGTGTVTFTADDGSLPSSGGSVQEKCEPATVTLDLGPSTDDRLLLSSAGDLCERWGYVTFFGESTITGSTGRWLIRPTGGGFASFRVDPWGTGMWTTTGELRGVVRPVSPRPPHRPPTELVDAP